MRPTMPGNRIHRDNIGTIRKTAIMVKKIATGSYKGCTKRSYLPPLMRVFLPWYLSEERDEPVVRRRAVSDCHA